MDLGVTVLGFTGLVAPCFTAGVRTPVVPELKPLICVPEPGVPAGVLVVVPGENIVGWSPEPVAGVICPPEMLPPAVVPPVVVELKGRV